MISERYVNISGDTSQIRKLLAVCIVSFVILIIGISSAWYVMAAQIPVDFPVATDVVIAEGMTHREISEHLEALGVISSSLLFQTILTREYAQNHIQAGTYRFGEPLDVRMVAQALVQGDFKTPLNRITFPEGFRARDFFLFFSGTSSQSSIDSLTLAEGQLFPDTYFITKDTTVEELMTSMRSTYEARIGPLRERIAQSGHTEPEIITLASILEREANNETSMQMVSGVLHNRLKIDMPLQVDAVFEYLIGKTSAELTETDLRIDSPYNTYSNVGFPPTPISNPGMMAIEAALNPTPHDFLYYLTGADGAFYYAKTFEEHRQNKARYLR